MKKIFYLFLFIFWTSTGVQSQSQVFDIRDYGAIGDGETLCSVAIQSAIDACTAAGGGQVLVPAGRFLSGSIRLKSRVNLHLAEGATLLGSTRRSDYDKNKWYALVLAQEVRDIAITGRGTIDGQGTALAADTDRMYKEGLLAGGYKDNRTHESQRPQLIDFEQCTKVMVSGISLLNSACWVQRYGRCDSLTIDGIKVVSMAFWNNDGIDLVDCRHTLVQHCNINAADDGICLKSDLKDKACEDILIRHCTIRSSASALKFGTNSYGGFKRIKVHNLTIFDTYRSAIALEIVDGGVLEDVEIKHIRAKNTGNAIFLRLGHRNQRVAPGQFRKVHIKDVSVEVPKGRPDEGYALPGPPVKEPHNLMPSSIVGLTDHAIEDVVLEDIRITHAGGGRCAVACVPQDSLHLVPEREKDYPEFSMFGELPAWGIYARHVKGLTLKKIRLTLLESDYRPALIQDDVQGAKIGRISVRKR